jgi:uncharacterized protein (DUF2141 family)
MNTAIKLVIALTAFIQVNLYGQHDLAVEITGIKAIQGDVYLSLYDSEKDWMFTDSAYRKVRVTVTEEVETLTIRNLPQGEYALAVYQDLNGNDSMDETEMKIPKEPFGFSNNPKGLRGPANFEQARFSFQGNDTLTVELVNNLFTPNKEKNEKPK